MKMIFDLKFKLYNIYCEKTKKLTDTAQKMESMKININEMLRTSQNFENVILILIGITRNFSQGINFFRFGKLWEIFRCFPVS